MFFINFRKREREGEKEKERETSNDNLLHMPQPGDQTCNPGNPGMCPGRE